MNESARLNDKPAALDPPARLGSDTTRAKSVPVVITPDMLAYDDDRRLDFERGMRHAPPMTIALILTLCAVFGWQMWNAGLSESRTAIEAYALVRDRVLAGEWWRMFTAAFLHGGPDHLAGNLVSLYVLGIACEHALGARGMLMLFILSALGGSIVSAWLSPGPSVGAFGAIFGLMGGIVLVLHRHRDRFFVRDKRIGVVIAVWAAYTLVLGAISPMVDNGAHLGGLVAGALIAPRLTLRLTPD